MPSGRDIRPVVEKHSAMPMARIRVARTCDELGLSEIRRGVVFVFAAWSMPAIVAFRRFTKTLSTLALGSVEVVVLDVDCLARETHAQIFGSLTTRGSGETIWVRDGRIVAREIIARNGSEALLASHTKYLIDDHAV